MKRVDPRMRVGIEIDQWNDLTPPRIPAPNGTFLRTSGPARFAPAEPLHAFVALAHSQTSILLLNSGRARAGPRFERSAPVRRGSDGSKTTNLFKIDHLGRLFGKGVGQILEVLPALKYSVPPDWRFEDDGYSGSTLVRPALERLRDLVAEGAIERVLVYGQDRLSRNYAYQVLLLEEFARHGAQVVFLKAPPADTPEQRLLVQFQGMIAENERAQISERTRRGKRCRAKAGVINVLSSSAPSR